ncbi:1621_t:CDS:2, partial [Racocetra fulgida]
MIQSLDNNTIRRISSGQVITRVEDVVKDNGSGIPENDRPAMALRYHTSKLEDFGGLSKVETYGFRGEALNSICAVSESTQITTKTSKDPVAINYSIDRTGKITAQKNSSKIGKAVQNLLTTYALAHPHIRFFLKLIYDNAARLNFKAGEWILPSMKSQMQSLNELYGVEFTNNVEFVVWDTDKETSLEIENENCDILDGSNCAKSKIIIEAILPKPDAKPQVIFKNSQSFIYVNNRPVTATRGEIKNIVSIVKSTYTEIACKHGWTGKSKNSSISLFDYLMSDRLFFTFLDFIANKKTPFIWINIKLPTYDYDNINNCAMSPYSVGKIPKVGLEDSSSSNLNLSPFSAELLYLSSSEPSSAGDIVVSLSSVNQRSPETTAQNDPELVLSDVDNLNEPLSGNQVVSDKRKGKMTDHGSTTSQVSDQVTKKKANKEKKNDSKTSRLLDEWYKTAQTSDVPTTLPIVSPSSTPPHTNNLQHKDRRGSKSMINPPQNNSYGSINIAYEESDNDGEYVVQNNKSNKGSNQRKQRKNSRDEGPVRKRSALDDTENVT